MQNKKIGQNKKQGFTLIELMLAVAFLGTLLLSVAMLAMRLVDMYTKGATMRAVNSVGSAITDDMRSSITSSSLWTEHIGDGLNRASAQGDKRQYYRYHEYKINEGTTDEESFIDYGAFCTNSYTYVFNYQPAMLRYREKPSSNQNPAIDFIRVGVDEDSSRPYGLVRIKDYGCAQFKRIDMTKSDVDAYNSSLSDEDKDDGKELVYDKNAFWQDGKSYIEANEDDITVLLDGSESDEGTDLQLYDFSVMAAVQSNATSQALYDIAFVLGTTRGGINVKSSNNYCKQKTKALSGQDYAESIDNNAISYCSVNRFEFVVRQTGGKE